MEPSCIIAWPRNAVSVTQSLPQKAKRLTSMLCLSSIMNLFLPVFIYLFPLQVFLIWLFVIYLVSSVYLSARIQEAIFSPVTWGISKSLSQHFKVSGSLCLGRAIFSTKHDYHRKSCIKLLICHKSLTLE